MTKWVMITIALLSGYGTVPCLLILIWFTIVENKEDGK